MLPKMMSLNQFKVHFNNVPFEYEALLSIFVENDYDLLSEEVYSAWLYWYPIGTSRANLHFRSYMAVPKNYDSLMDLLNSTHLPVQICHGFIPQSPCHFFCSSYYNVWNIRLQSEALLILEEVNDYMWEEYLTT